MQLRYRSQNRRSVSLRYLVAGGCVGDTPGAASSCASTDGGACVPAPYTIYGTFVCKYLYSYDMYIVLSRYALGAASTRRSWRCGFAATSPTPSGSISPTAACPTMVPAYNDDNMCIDIHTNSTYRFYIYALCGAGSHAVQVGPPF